MFAASDAKNIAVEPPPLFGGDSDAEGAIGAYFASEAVRDSARLSSAADQVRAA
jgi:hypothetical protein